MKITYTCPIHPSATGDCYGCKHSLDPSVYDAGCTLGRICADPDQQPEYITTKSRFKSKGKPVSVSRYVRYMTVYGMIDGVYTVVERNKTQTFGSEEEMMEYVHRKEASMV